MSVDIADIPLADDDPTDAGTPSVPRKLPKPAQALPKRLLNLNGALISSVDCEDVEEKVRLISRVLELQNTLDDLSHRVDTVKEESAKLRSENHVLGQYIENLVNASSLFRPTNKEAPGKK